MLNRSAIYDLKKIVSSSQSNTDFCRPNFAERFMTPFLLERLRVCGEGRVAYTWARPFAPLDRAPTRADWIGGKGPLWVGDLIFTPSVTARQAVSYMNADMRDGDIAHHQEKYLFWREGPQRYGYGRA
jgi:hypothetical protein